MKPSRLLGGLAGFLLVLVACFMTQMVWAARPKGMTSDLDAKEFSLPELYISTSQVPLTSILAKLPNRAAWETAAVRKAADGSSFGVFIDPRSGTAVSIVGAVPLVPGDGIGNSVTLASLGKFVGSPVTAMDAATLAKAARAHVVANAAQLGIDVAQLGAVRATQVHPDLWQVRIPQALQGVPVRHGRLAATISHGNLVAIGTETWGNVAASTRSPRVSRRAGARRRLRLRRGPDASTT